MSKVQMKVISPEQLELKQIRLVKRSHKQVMSTLKKHFVEKRRNLRYLKHANTTIIKTLDKYISQYIIEIVNKQSTHLQLSLKKHLIHVAPDIIRYLMDDDYIMDRFDVHYGQTLKKKFLVKDIQAESSDFIMFCEKDNIIQQIHEHIDNSIYIV